ncbi:MAG: Uma2 family endonuclease [Phormidesmis sp.]
MTVAKDRPITLEEYLNYDDGTDTRYELIDGMLVEMGAESDGNIMIGTFLIIVFSRFIPYQLIRRGSEVEVSGNLANTRIPDLLVLTEEGLAAVAGKKRSLITLDMPAPALAVEVVSSSDTDKASRERDYVTKRREYSQRGISEYWLIDPVAEVVLVLALVDGQYQEQAFRSSDSIASSVLPQLTLSAMQILKGEL